MPTRSLHLVFCSLCFAFSANADPTAQQLVERLDFVRRPTKSFEVTLEITEMKSGKVSHQSQHHVIARKQSDSARFDAMARCLSPDADRGKSVLTVGRELWFYDPKSKRPTQLSPAHFHGRFFVSDALSTSFAADYEGELDGEETIKDAGKNDVPCLRLKMKRRDGKGLTPELIEYWIDKKLLQPIKAQLFTTGGKLLRTSYYAGYARVLDEVRPSRVIVVSNTERGLVTDLKLSGFALHEWPAEQFTKDALPAFARGGTP